jgi:hypothetical protein
MTKRAMTRLCPKNNGAVLGASVSKYTKCIKMKVIHPVSLENFFYLLIMVKSPFKAPLR